jgi:hypothetical protein
VAILSGNCFGISGDGIRRHRNTMPTHSQEYKAFLRSVNRDVINGAAELEIDFAKAHCVLH